MHLASRPTQQATVNPFTRPVPATPADADRPCQPEQRLTFGQHRANATVPQSRSQHDRRDHYIARAEEAQRLSEAADEQQIKVIHLEMAARYYSLANHYVGRPTPMSLVG